ncbi:MAG: hypothetical protein Q4C59_05110 [Lachnospiraceae bacterium]|nr:hypothetical protein [Lachnospiraceae bacterium]
MARMKGIQRKLYKATYDKPGINKKALRFRNSLNEVKKILSQVGKKPE